MTPTTAPRFASDDDFDLEVTAELCLPCPRCHTLSLRREQRMRIEVDVCERCKGIWLDRGELDALLDQALLLDGYRRDLVDDGDFDLVPSGLKRRR